MLAAKKCERTRILIANLTHLSVVQVWADKDYKKAHLGTRWKANPFGGASHAKGIVLEKVTCASFLYFMIEQLIECLKNFDRC
jgi:hypothetical protein